MPFQLSLCMEAAYFSLSCVWAKMNPVDQKARLVSHSLDPRRASRTPVVQNRNFLDRCNDADVTVLLSSSWNMYSCAAVVPITQLTAVQYTQERIWRWCWVHTVFWQRMKWKEKTWICLCPELWATVMFSSGSLLFSVIYSVGQQESRADRQWGRHAGWDSNLWPLQEQCGLRLKTSWWNWKSSGSSRGSFRLHGPCVFCWKPRCFTSPNQLIIML